MDFVKFRRGRKTGLKKSKNSSNRSVTFLRKKAFGRIDFKSVDSPKKSVGEVLQRLRPW